MSTQTAKLEITNQVAAELGPFLVNAGFSRKKNTLKFVRKINDWVQIVDFFFHLPRFSDDTSLCRFEPQLILENTKLAQEAEKIAGDKSLVSENVVVNEPFGFLGPERNLRDWRPASFSDLPKISLELKEYFFEHVIVFVDEFCNYEGFLRLVEKKDSRIPRSLSFQLFVAAVNMIMDRRDAVCATIYQAFNGKPALQKKYSFSINFAKTLEG